MKYKHKPDSFKCWKNGRERHNSGSEYQQNTINGNFIIEINEMMRHFPRLINLTQEFNKSGNTELVDKTLEFMKGFIEMVNKKQT